jgi:hypothetical protein
MSAIHPSTGDAETRWQQAIEAGDLGVWDLRLELETVQYSPQWKRRFGFPEPHSADSTDFWRCRVHPDDFDGMLAAIRAHTQGQLPGYEARFRLRSNGSGYRTVRSRGRVIERGTDGRAMRMVGTMVDLTERPPSPRAGLPDGPGGGMKGVPLRLPFHLLVTAGSPAAGLAEAQRAEMTLERDRVVGMVADLLQASVAELDGLRMT